MAEQRPPNTPKRHATRKDVALRAGVSVATVSYVLNKSQKVPERTAEKVLRAAKELEYRPNYIARSLVTRETRQIAIVLNNIANPIYADLIRGFESEAIAHGYFVAICTGFNNLDDYFDHFASRRIDGILIEALPYKYHMDKLRSLVDTGVKAVIFGSTGLDARLVSHIETDYPALMADAVAYLAKLGHREIVYLSGLSRQYRYDSRIDGFIAAMKALGVERPDRLVLAAKEDTNTDIADGRSLAERLLASRRRFTAVICTNDLMAVGAMQAFREAGRAVPAQVSVMGIDGASIGELTEPSLTTMAVPYATIGSRAFHMLYNDMSTGTKSYLKNRAELVERRSTARLDRSARSR